MVLALAKVLELAGIKSEYICVLACVDSIWYLRRVRTVHVYNGGKNS